ncbi:MAG: hypothetical protein ACT4RN_14090 [Pseudonocardia sp.]
MPLIEKFDTPARLTDAPVEPLADGRTFYERWNDEVAALAQFVGGEPGPGFPEPDGPDGLPVDVGPAVPDGPDPGPPDGRLPGEPPPAMPAPTVPPEQLGAWVDPRVVDGPVVGTRTLSWIGMSRASLMVWNRDDRAEAFRACDNDRVNKQPEYVEWHATRRGSDKKIVKVAFTTESIEYWQLLGETFPDTVVKLYQRHVSPEVRRSDLYFDAGGGFEIYNTRNRWNTCDGIMHLIGESPGNRLVQILGLCQGGTVNATIDNYANAAAGSAHAVDDYTDLDVGAVARAGFDVAPHDPIGLYIEGWDDTGFTKPDGSPVDDYWRVTRGTPETALRLEYEVPEGEGFVVGDIRIGGRPVEYGAQVAEHVHSVIRVDVLGSRP